MTLLKDEEDFRTAWNYLALSAWRTGVEIVAFTLMSNHVHEILVCKDARMEYELTSAEKCSILKHLFFNNKTSVPQLSRVLGLPRKLIQRIMST